MRYILNEREVRQALADFVARRIGGMTASRLRVDRLYLAGDVTVIDANDLAPEESDLAEVVAPVATELADCQAHLKELREEREGLILRLRTAARDEGELPLFDLDSE